MDLHPFIVHFPIALLLTGALFDAIGVGFRQDRFLWTGYVLLLLGAACAIGAAFTGDTAAESARGIPGIQDDLDWHETLGSAVTLTAVLLSLFRTHLLARKQFSGMLRVIYLVAAIGLTVLVGNSAYTGGLLVQMHGAGTVQVSPD